MVRYEDVPQHFNVTRYFLDRHLEEGRGGRIALYCGDRTVTYEELVRFTNRYAYYLDYVRPRVVVTDPVTHAKI